MPSAFHFGHVQKNMTTSGHFNLPCNFAYSVWHRISSGSSMNCWWAIHMTVGWIRLVGTM